MRSIALVQTEDRNVNQLQQNITQALNPMLKNPLLNGYILTEISLAAGANIIEHGLGRPLIGWFLVRRRANESVYDTQDSNTSPSTTLQLTASGAVVVDIYVF